MLFLLNNEFLTVLIQGISEAFPVSSSMHLYLLNCNISREIAAILHFGMSFAFFAILHRFIWNILKKKNVVILLNCFIMTIPTIIVGYLIKDYMNFCIKSAAWINFIAAIIMFFSVFINGRKNIAHLTKYECIIIGVLLILAFLPGASRLGISFTVLRFFGLRKIDALVISLFLGIPVLLGASIICIQKIQFLKIMPLLIKSSIAGICTYFSLFITFKMLNYWQYFSYYRYFISLLILYYF